MRWVGVVFLLVYFLGEDQDPALFWLGLVFVLMFGDDDD